MLRNDDSALRFSHLRSFLNEVLSLNAQEYLAEEMADVIICLPQ